MGAFVFALLISKSITKQIKELQEKTSKITLGNPDVKIIPKGDEEIVQLTNVFNSMIERIKKDSDEKLKIHTELKKIEKTLDESSYVAITNKNGIIKKVNAKFCESSKYSEEELIGKNHRILKSGYHTKKNYKDMWDTISSGKVWNGEIKNKAKDGSMYWNDMVIVPFMDKEIKEFVSIRRDITERKKYQEETHKNEKMIMIGKFSARLAHDLRNLLPIIQVSLENLKLKYGMDESSEKSFSRVERSINRIVHQVDDVLNFVREQPVMLRKTETTKVIKESVDSIFIPSAIKVIYPENNYEIVCDKKQLATAINNLILNGIQAAKGEGIIKIRINQGKKIQQYLKWKIQAQE